ncbi:MAG: ribosomal RNA small subunit methyltransferase A [Flavobacteriales bacterium]|nr:ribosomal RNA small subunit methyltransferase A [Flavobacteriales bacterium]
MNQKKFNHKKKFGQHFLLNEKIILQIVESIDYKKDSQIIEIGPGLGALTKHIVKKCNPIIIEIDSSAIELIKKNISKDITIIHGDFLKINLNPILKKKNIIIGNFPYNISTQIIFKILEHKNKIQTVIGMFQKEVSERICSSPGSKKYGITSVLVQAYYNTKILFNVDRENFFPKPKVESTVIKLTRNKTRKINCDESVFISLVKQSFNLRRKKLKNSLKSVLLNFEKIDLDLLNKRAEDLSVEEFIKLTNLITKNES